MLGEINANLGEEFVREASKGVGFQSRDAFDAVSRC